MRLIVTALLLLLLLLSPLASADATLSIDDFLRRDEFDQLLLSPDGEHVAATVPLDDRNALVTLRLSDLQAVGQLTMPANTWVDEFRWANDERIVFSVAEKFGQLEQPQSTGELFGMNVDGSRAGALAGYRALAGQKNFTRVRQASQRVVAQLVDVLESDPDEVLVAVRTWNTSQYLQVERMNVKSGKRSEPLATAPVHHDVGFMADASGEVRFAHGVETDNRRRLFVRASREHDWTLLNDPNRSGLTMFPIGFAADGATAYLQVREARGPDAIHALDMATLERRPVLRDDVVDPSRYFHSPIDRSPYAVLLNGPSPRIAYLDAAHPFARLHASMAKMFPGHLVLPVSFTRDGNLALFLVISDRNSGDFYLLDRAGKSARLVASRSQWLDPETMASTRAVAITARDGTPLHGFLTTPHGADPRALPLIVNPHGGPFGVFDNGLFDAERQLLASRGYAVLQVNFRGSGNYGAAFEAAGYRQWGGTMQDDVTDATRWAIAEGIADPRRICIYGGSYGAYAALMGAVREPDLFRCVAGNVGIYDLAALQSDRSVTDRVSRNFWKETVGDGNLDTLSPIHRAAEITAPVFLAAGELDKVAPLHHTERMRDALQKAGREVETVFYPNEGHGNFLLDNRRDFYTRLLAFFDRHLAAGSD